MGDGFKKFMKDLMNFNPKQNMKNNKISPKTVISVKRTKSTESTFSLMDVSKGQQKEGMGSRLSPLTKPSDGQTVYDSCAYIMHCSTHEKISVRKDEKSGAVWMPFIALPTNMIWDDGARLGAHLILISQDPSNYSKTRNNPPFKTAKCMQLFRLQLPQTQKFVSRLIYYIDIDSNNSEHKCCEDTKLVQWLPTKEVMSNKIQDVWGPELREFCELITKFSEAMLFEYSLDKAFTYVPRNPPRNLEEIMLQSCRITEKDIERLYGDFIEHCFPSFYMTIYSFKDYMSKYGFEKQNTKLQRLFKAFNYNDDERISFHELLIGLAAIEPNATTAELRIKIIFRYYDMDSNGFLDESEFKSMCRDIDPELSESNLQMKVNSSSKAIGSTDDGIPYDDFARAVGSHKFRGTSGLCRSSKGIFEQISKVIANRTLKKAAVKTILSTIVKDRQYKGVCNGCKEKEYKFATHSVTLRVDGTWTDPKRIENVESLNGTELEIASKTDPKVEEFSAARHSSEQVFNPKSIANNFLRKIREFNGKKGTRDDYKGLCEDASERQSFVKNVEILCTEVQKIVSQEDRCVQLCSPAFIMGDIHGNLEDLLSLERTLWKSIPIVSANYVFLGDYVDRGKWSVECALYVMALKLLTPNKVVILRGNHEERRVNNKYSFHEECVKKYGHDLGERVYDLTNKVFDCLPICAVIDDSIYCSHGGIPKSTKRIEDINTVAVELSDPEEQSDIAWEILWSDPCNQQVFDENYENFPQVRVDDVKGFIRNEKRGTAYLFAEEAVNAFLHHNGLTHIVRAHEVPPEGFTFHFGTKCMTVFSCSHYMGSNNECASIFVDNQKLRIVRIDTQNNATATDDR